jgi:hypothetical protein
VVTLPTSHIVPQDSYGTTQLQTVNAGALEEHDVIRSDDAILTPSRSERECQKSKNYEEDDNLAETLQKLENEKKDNDRPRVLSLVTQNHWLSQFFVVRYERKIETYH